MSADNPYAAPEATDHIAPDDGHDVPDDMGGITRGQFWLGYLGSIIVGFLIAFLFPPAVLLLYVIIPILACFRMKNVGYHPALGLLILVPVANIWAGILCGAAPTGYRHTKKLDTIGKVIIGIIIGLFVLGLLAGFLLPALSR